MHPVEWALRQCPGEPSLQVLLAALVVIANPAGEVAFSARVLGALTGISRARMLRDIRALEKVGAIRSEGVRLLLRQRHEAEGRTERPVTFRAYLAALPPDAPAIPPGDPIFAYCDEVGIDPEMLAVAWAAFKTTYTTERKLKRYVDWRAVFRNAVRRNYGRLWFIDRAGAAAKWTTAGNQALIEYRRGAAIE